MTRLDLNTVLGWITPGSRVLDLGCGDGAFLARLRDERDASGVGVDIDPDNLIASVSKGLDVIQEDINDGLHCFTTNAFDVVVLAHALQELTHPHMALERMVDIGDEAIVSFPQFRTLAVPRSLGIQGQHAHVQGHAAALVRHAQHSLLHREGLRVAVFRLKHRYHQARDHCRARSTPIGQMAPQPFCHQRDLSHTSRWHLIAGLLLACCVLPAAAQQSTRYEQFELHHSIVYTTFLSPRVAAEYGITRGADKAILTLSVRDADSGDIAGRPMKIEGRTWDLITGGDMRVKEIREGRATYYIVPFEFLDREYRFFEFTFQPDGAASTFEHKMKVQLWRQS